MLNIEIKTIPHKKQRYATLGDYFHKKGKVCFRISELGRWEYEVAVAVHELVEWALIKKKGIPIEAIDKFDIEFEENRKRGIHSEDAEPGDDPNAPYHIEHGFATAVERMVMSALGSAWEGYCKACEGVDVKEGK